MVQDQLCEGGHSRALRSRQQHWAEAENLTADAEVQPQVAAIPIGRQRWGRRTWGISRRHGNMRNRCAGLSAELTEKGQAYWAGQVAILGEEGRGMGGIRGAPHLRRAAAAANGAEHEDSTEKHSVNARAVRPARSC